MVKTSATSSPSSNRASLDASSACTSLGRYAALGDARQAKTRLQAAGLWVVFETETDHEEGGADDGSTQRNVPPAVLYVRNRDVRKARGILRAFHVLPDDTLAPPQTSPNERPSKPNARKEAASGNGEGSAGASPETAQERISEEENGGAEVSEEEGAVADWMPRIRFVHMVIGGAVLLALATALFLWLSASAG
ncbi:hypothetical protein CRI93_01800 [Longimonas halophila]|uniref:DUF2007 domain-containing protein n=1 Tax=Longimonas halophila TaxID=1469170 RepID=A0A2H3NQL8_9BACT|nr:hypothetical protein [Longimonas halophila]PEN09487.1 hypothetical protein CRI93_01800 [Longimonas halophila]